MTPQETSPEQTPAVEVAPTLHVEAALTDREFELLADAYRRTAERCVRDIVARLEGPFKR